MIRKARREISSLGPKVGSETNDCILEINLTTLTIGQCPFVKDLEENIGYVLDCQLGSRKQVSKSSRDVPSQFHQRRPHYKVSASRSPSTVLPCLISSCPYLRYQKKYSLFIPHKSSGSSDQSRDCMFIVELRHVQLYQRPLLIGK